MHLDLKRLFRRRGPVAIDVAPDEAHNGDWSSDAASRSGRAIATLETKPTARSRGLAESQKSYEEVMLLVHKIGEHLDVQAQRQQRLDDVMPRLPAALDSISEISRQSARLLEVLSESLEKTARRESSLGETMLRLSESATRQGEVMGQLRDQIEVGNHSTRHVAEALGEFHTALGAVAHTNTRTLDVLSTMAAESLRREATLEQSLRRTQRWMIAALCVCAAAAVVGMVVGMV